MTDPHTNQKKRQERRLPDAGYDPCARYGDDKSDRRSLSDSSDEYSRR